MTTIREITVKCAVCEAESRQTVVTSTNTFGAPDLDLRPPEMQRSTMRHWVQECPSCGYVAGDLSQAPAGASAVVASDAYAQRAQTALGGDLARRFACSAFILTELGARRASGESSLCAAWAADDAGAEGPARSYRAEAAAALRAALADPASGLNESDRLTLRVRLIDILRRARLWDAAKAAAVEALASAEDQTIRSVAAFGHELAEQEDDRCVTVAEATAA